ncbi:SusC/RagA family TonB-linked outer membrane protein [Gaetbulibacter saemankumensis]|uniref:SusC/RagA family TonB-linked outer membrane protein n=1 Tax=Gaetbulibacter saemankumensis TaxID=311208 RepID=UPI000428E877|nr:TonB-dependent receptor [Gaetbulibacter saemankumensis]
MKIKLTKVLTLERKKTLAILMRTLIFLFCTTVFSLSPITLFSQDTQVEISADQTISIDEVFKIIKKQTDINFIYKADLFKDYPNVTVRKGVINANDLLNSILSDANFNFQFSDNNSIIITEKEASITDAQQKITISGTVKDENGMPLAGANIYAKNAGVGTMTDFDGNFQVSYPDTAKDVILVFSYVGYEKQEIPVTNPKHVNVTMVPDASELDQVVVIGYGSSKVKDVTGSISHISSEEVDQAPMSTTIESMLQGKASGVNVNIQSASPTAPVSVIIRGASSLSGDNQPLWVIDGVPQYSTSNEDFTGNIANTLYNLNLNDVESIDVLKDASATAVYGSRAANGVIIVTTKKGSSRMKPSIELSSRVGVQVQDFNGFDYFERDQYIKATQALAKEYVLGFGRVDSNVSPYIDKAAFDNLLTSEYDFSDLVMAPNAYYDSNTDWLGEMTQSPINQIHNLAVQGGNEQTTYYTSFNYNQRDGIVKSGQSEIYGGRLNLETKITEQLTFGVNLNGSSRNTDDKDYMLDVIRRIRPDMPVYNDDGTLFKYDNFTENPYTTLKNIRTSKGINFSGTAFLDINFLNDFTFKTAFTNNYVTSELLTYVRRDSRFNFANGTRARSDSKFSINVWENTLTYAKLIDKHDIRALAGYSMENAVRDYNYISLANFPDDDILNNFRSATAPRGFDEQKNENALISQFARVHYKFDDRYIVSGTVRRDGSSRFGANKRWGFFPSAAAAWIITGENFMKNSNIEKYISYLKLRSSFGKTGSQNLGNYDYLTLADGRTQFNEMPGIRPSSIGNADLQWEETNMFDLALDYGFLQDRIRGSVGIYEKNSDELIYNLPLAPSSSFNSITANVASIENKGLEFNINYDIISTTDSRLTFDFNYAKNVNKIVKLNGVTEELNFPTSGTSYIKVAEGEEMGQWYGYQTAGRFYSSTEEAIALNPRRENGTRDFYNDRRNTAGDMYYIDQNGDNEITGDDRVKLGTSVPKGFGGFGLTFRHKNFMFNSTFTYAYGHKRFWQLPMTHIGNVTGTQNLSNIIAGQSTTLVGAENAVYPRMSFGGIGNNAQFSDFYLYDASFVRLNALNLTYKLPNKLLKNSLVQGVDFSFQATNLFTITKYPGFDPQGNFSDSRIGSGMAIDNSTYPNAQLYSLGIKVKLQ